MASLRSQSSVYSLPTSQSSSASSSTAQTSVEADKSTSTSRPYRLSDFYFQRTLGTGSFGRVHLVRSKCNLHFYAIKVLSKERVVTTRQVVHTQNERRLLMAVNHPFIVKLWGAFQDAANLYMIMDYIPGGELFSLLRRSNRFPDPVAKFYAAEVALALNYLHARDIIYRDLKPENILLARDGHIKLTDFGFARTCATHAWTLCGTPDYLAPEIIRGERYGKAVDWWALGVLIFELLAGLPPFYVPSGDAVARFERICAGPAAVRWPLLAPRATDLVVRLLECDPARRLGTLQHGAGDVFAHPWFGEVDWEVFRTRHWAIRAPYIPRILSAGDASAFDTYLEDNAEATYGQPVEDKYGDLFPDFEYTRA